MSRAWQHAWLTEAGCAMNLQISRFSERSFLRLSGSILIALCAGACASYSDAPPGATDVRQGVVEQINATQLQSLQHQGIGAVVGGIAGAGLGNLVGRGSGRDVATLLGALGGGFLGNQVQQRNFDQPRPGQQVVVRTDSGVIVAVTQPVDPGLHPGMRVYLEGTGMEARVTAALDADESSRPTGQITA